MVRDLVILCAALGVFMLFHHVLPRSGGGPLRDIVNVTAQNAPAALAAAAPTTQAAATKPTPAASATTGDFSATFPTEDTGKDATLSYQGDDLRIAINRVEENDATYYVADVWVKSIDVFRTAFAKGQYGQGIHEMPTAMAKANNAILAVSGDYYGARAKGVVIRNGELYRDTPWGDVAMLTAAGELQTVSKEQFSTDDATAQQVYQAWSFGPALLRDGKAITDFTDAIRGKNPRCAIGYYEPGHYCFVVVDGRQPGYSVGMTLAELAKVFEGLGCQSAYNLDGGQTAMMVFQGQPVNQAYHGGRQSSDIIYLGGNE